MTERKFLYMTTTTVHQLPAAPTGLPTRAACSCGKWDFMGLDNANMRAEIASHISLSPAHGKVA